MATKPSTLPEWATDADRTVEPSAGEKGTGWQAGYAPPARKMNWLFNIIYQWLVWIDAHLSNGATANDIMIAGSDVTGTDQDGGDVTISGGSSTGDGGSEIVFELAKAGQGAGSTTRTPAEVARFGEDGRLSCEGIDTTASAGDDGATFTGGSSGRGAVATGGSNANGIEATGGAGNTHGILGTGQGTGYGVAGNGGGSAGSGVRGTGGASGGIGVEGTSSSNGHAVSGNAVGGTGCGVYGTCSSSGEAGVMGEVNSSASYAVKAVNSSTYYALRAYNTSSTAHGNAALWAEGVACYGAIIQGDTTTPERAALRIVPQDALPTTGAVGDLCVYGSKLYICTNATGPVWTVVGTQT